MSYLIVRSNWNVWLAEIMEMSCVIGRMRLMHKALGVNPDYFGEVELLCVKYLTYVHDATGNIGKPED